MYYDEYEYDNEEDNRSYISEFPKKMLVCYPVYLPSRLSDKLKKEKENEEKEKKLIVNIPIVKNEIPLELPKYSKQLLQKKQLSTSSEQFTIHVSKELVFEAVKCVINNGKTNIKVKLF
jgi:hypothetical protein